MAQGKAGIKKKLYKEDQKGKYIIAGVCAGLAEYFGINVWLMRALTVLAGCAFGVGVMLYAVGMVMLPDKWEALNK